MHSGPLFSVKIILPSDTICSLMANLVELPGEDGVIGVLQNHKPLFANLKRGKLLIYTENNITQYYLLFITKKVKYLTFLYLKWVLTLIFNSRKYLFF